MSKFKVKKMDKASGATGDPVELPKKDKLEVVSKIYTVAKNTTPSYVELEFEVDTYTIVLPGEVDIPDLIQINKLCAEGQTYLSRVNTIERLAINNCSNWERVCAFMKAFVEDLQAEVLLEEDVRDLKNALQEATIRKRLSKQLRTLNELEDKLTEAKTFLRSIETKRKDLQSILTNLNRQANNIRAEKPINF